MRRQVAGRGAPCEPARRRCATCTRAALQLQDLVTPTGLVGLRLTWRKWVVVPLRELTAEPREGGRGASLCGLLC